MSVAPETTMSQETLESMIASLQTSNNDQGSYRLSGVYEIDGILLREPFMGRRCVAKAQSLNLNAQDIIVASYPKSGTTWMQEIVSLMQHGGDVASAHARTIEERVPYLEFGIPGQPCVAEALEDVPSPRAVKTHLPGRMLHNHVTKSKVKAIVVLRNPLDTLVSYYHFYRSNIALDFQGSWDEFFEMSRSKQLMCGDNLEWIADWWGYRHLDNVHIVHYEDLKRDLRGGVQALAQFLDLGLTDAQLDRVAAATTFDAMKNNSAVNQSNITMPTQAKPETAQAKTETAQAKTETAQAKTETAQAKTETAQENGSQQQSDDPHPEAQGEGSPKPNLFERVMRPEVSAFMRKGTVGDWKNYFSREQHRYLIERYDEVLVSKGLEMQF